MNSKDNVIGKLAIRIAQLEVDKAMLQTQLEELRGSGAVDPAPAG